MTERYYKPCGEPKERKEQEIPVVRLRDMVEQDIEDYVRWFTVETEFNNWDAPWEAIETTEEAEREGWTEYYQSVRELPEEVGRWKFEIEAEGRHIGWVCSYKDLEYLENEDGILALGIDIPCSDARGKGYGSKALILFMDYLAQHGHRSFYIQTWSGNTPMLRVAKKLGFKEAFRLKDHRVVEGKSYDALTLRFDGK